VIGVRVPGKVVLLGEYAVLDGAPAIVAAVDCGVIGRYSPGPTLQIEAPDDRYVGPALLDAPAGTYAFFGWNPTATPTKPGLGSSAAATVAAVVLAQRARGMSAEPDYIFARAALVHHRVQGSGSGIDIAASTFGGILHFQSGEVEQVHVDIGERLGVAFVGGSSATGPRAVAYRAAPDRGAFVNRSTAIVAGWAADPIGAFAEACDNLADLDRRIGLGWWLPAYGPVLAAARAHGGAAKPSGAGGGDVVVALFPDSQRRDAWRSDLPALGAIPLDLHVATGACGIP
jgi:phosphomevalonate kinase